MERKQGYQTKNRQMILDYLKQHKDHAVHASDIMAYMDAEGYAVNKTTVYRYLDKLAEEKMLLHYVADKGEQSAYQYVEQPSRCREHLHLQCISCGKIAHLDCAFMGEISHHILSDHGFRLSCKDSMLYGLCSECEKKQAEKNAENR